MRIVPLVAMLCGCPLRDIQPTSPPQCGFDPDPHDESCETLSHLAVSDHVVYFVLDGYQFDRSGSGWASTIELGWDLETGEISALPMPDLVGPAGAFYVDPSTGAVTDEDGVEVASVDPGSTLLLSPDGTRVLVRGPVDAVVSLVGDPEGDFTVGPTSASIWSADSCVVSVTAEQDGLTVRCSASDPARTRDLGPGSWFDPNANDRFVAVRSQEESLSVTRFLDRSTGRSFEHTEASPGAPVLAWAADGSTALLGNPTPLYPILRVDLATGEVAPVEDTQQGVITPFADSYALELSSGTLSLLSPSRFAFGVSEGVLSRAAIGVRLVFATNNGSVERLNPDGSIHPLVALPPAAVHNVFALPDGTVLVDDHLNRVVMAVDPATGAILASVSLAAFTHPR